MTQEEKAQAYDRAIEIINAYYHKIKYSSLSSASTDREVLERAFPELKESEDDRIRKEITELVMQPTWKTEKEFHRRKELCAWLEKQVTTAEKDRGGYNLGFACGKQRVLKNPEDFGLCKKPEWSEEDEKKRTLLISILEVNHPNAYFKVNPANTLNMEAMHTEELVSWLKSLKEGCAWKPSEEQISELGKLAKGLRGRAMRATSKDTQYEAINSLYEQLKKLKG